MERSLYNDSVLEEARQKIPDADKLKDMLLDHTQNFAKVKELLEKALSHDPPTSFPEFNDIPRLVVKTCFGSMEPLSCGECRVNAVIATRICRDRYFMLRA